MSHSESDEDEGLNLFEDPPDYYPPSPKPTTETHTLLTGEVISLRLVGHNPLWGHHLWQGGRIISRYLENDPTLFKDKYVLELGAGAGLPSLVCAILGARKVVVTDYPDPDLIENLWFNIDHCELLAQKDQKNIVAQGYTWGASPAPLLQELVHARPKNDFQTEAKFDTVILADLLFNHSEHKKLVSTVTQTLSQSSEARALVFFTPYRPWLYEKDMAFFDLARESGLLVEKVLEEKMNKVMFEADRGDEELRRTVFGYEMKWVAPSSHKVENVGEIAKS